MDGLAAAVELPHDIIAIAEATTRSAVPDASLEAATDLLSEILEEERIHRALEPDMEFADQSFGDGE
jgi:hypothetical protein